MKASMQSVRATSFGPVAGQRTDISALMDGELDDAAVDRAIDGMLASDDLATFWADAHRVGDWMRSDEVVGVGDGQAFLRRFSAALDDEPTVLAPRVSTRFATRRFWIRTGLPGASIAAALVAVAWVAVPFGRDADSARPVVAATAIGKTVDVDRLSDYVAAHRDVTPFGYRGAATARPASFTTPVVAADTPPSH